MALRAQSRSVQHASRRPAGRGSGVPVWPTACALSARVATHSCGAPFAGGAQDGQLSCLV
eukprot:5751308-Prymnesium_polylepis.4